ncbi:LuxR C-terminal-related transcriptional regulator [Streptomyces anandii]|uniref:LuxR C-terminal-related transcriptional regulator n=1 Tax=Streptomyces anandii TaxID=285454 RepID=UPI0037A96021
MSADLTPAGRLTPAQIRVIAGYARGLQAAQIATDLGISPRAIRGHVGRAARRTGTTGRPYAALIDHAYRHRDFDDFPDLAVKAATPPELRLERCLRRTLECLARGMSTNATAQALGVSKATAREYRHRLYRRLGTTHPPHAVALAWQNRLLGPPPPAPGPIVDIPRAEPAQTLGVKP